MRRLHGHPRLIAAAGAAGAGALAAAVTLQRRHLQSIASDPEYRRLSQPVGGRRMEVIGTDGTVLNAEVLGPDGAPTFVLAHGWTEQLSFWGPVIRRLVDGDFRVVAYDLRGHGRSRPAADGDYSLDRFGDDVEAVMAAATVAGAPVVVAGHSLGAMSIAAWAQRHDPRARADAAALINTGLGDLMAGHLLLGELAKWLHHPWASRLVMGSRLRVPPFSTPLQQAAVRHTAFGPTASAGQVAFYERMLIDCPADVRAACGVALSDMDLWDAVARLTVPTLVIAGDRDRLTPPAFARRIAADLPCPAGVVELPATGHMSPLERPREIADALQGLMARVRSAPEPAPVPVAVDGGRLAVYPLGNRSEAPAVLAIHGITSTSRTWLATARALGGRASLMAVDLRGRGRSRELPPPFGLDAHVRDMVAVLDHLGLERAAVVGHSLGAYIAARLAVRHPDRVTRLVLVDGGLTIPGSRDGDPAQFIDTFLGATLARLALEFADAADYRAWWERHPAVAGSDIDPDDLLQYAAHDLVGEPPHLRPSINPGVVRGDGLGLFGNPDAERLQVPAVLLCAERGMVDDPHPMQPLPVVQTWAAADPARRRAQLVTGVNHYTIVLGARGAAAVAAAVAEAALT